MGTRDFDTKILSPIVCFQVELTIKYPYNTLSVFQRYNMRSQNQSFAKQLRDGKQLIGTIVTLGSSAVVELLSDSGLDWLFIDAEHSPLTMETTQKLLQASNVPVLIRIASADPITIKKALDLGAAGIIVPQVNSAQLAKDVVSWCRYPPDGERGVGLARAHRYGFEFEDYLKNANQETIIVVQAEHKIAVNNIEAIAATAGIDAILIGPYDLSASYGKPGAVDDPEIQNAITKIAQACQTNNVVLGIFGINVAAVLPHLEQGASLITIGVDSVFLGTAMQQCIGELRTRGVK